MAHDPDSPNLAPAPARRDLTVWATLLLAALALWWLFWQFAQTNRSLDHRPRQLLLFFAAFLIFLIATRQVWRARPALSRRLALLIIIAGLLFRLTVAPSRPIATSDIYRYLWEGRVVRAGLNPYTHSPRSPELIPLHNWVWPLVQHKSVSAAYPPVAQHVFALGGRAPLNSVIGLKLVLAFFDVLTMLLLASLIARLGRPPSWVIVYAWHPLAVCELSARGHLDSIGIFFLVAALRLLVIPTSLGRAASGASLALSILAKGYALITAPFLLLAAKPHRLTFTLVLLLTALAACAPFLTAGPALFRGLATYTQNWTGNASLFALLDFAFSRLTPRHDLLARAVCALALASFLLTLIATRPRPYRALDAVRLSFRGLAALFLLSPTVYPWYLTWTLPLLCLHRSIPWLLLTGTIYGFYAHDFAGHQQQIWWVTSIEYALPLAAALALWLRRPPGRGSPSPVPPLNIFPGHPS